MFSQGRVFRADDPGQAHELSSRRSCSPRRSSARSAAVGSYSPPQRARALQGRGRRPVAGVQLTPPAWSRPRSTSAPAGSRVPKIWIAHDIGRAHQPGARARAGEGSVYMGARRGADGGAGRSGACRRSSPTRSCTRSRRCSNTRASPRSTCPRSITELVEDPDPNCPFGAKEVGQGPLLPVMPAVANAIYDAVGVRIDELPITPDKVLRGAGEESEGREPARRSGELSRRFPTPSRCSCCRPGKAATATR